MQTPTTLYQLIWVFKIRLVSAMAKLNNAVNSSSVYIMLDVATKGVFTFLPPQHAPISWYKAVGVCAVRKSGCFPIRPEAK